MGCTSENSFSWLHGIVDEHHIENTILNWLRVFRCLHNNVMSFDGVHSIEMQLKFKANSTRLSPFFTKIHLQLLYYLAPAFRCFRCYFPSASSSLCWSTLRWYSDLFRFELFIQKCSRHDSNAKKNPVNVENKMVELDFREIRRWHWHNE